MSIASRMIRCPRPFNPEAGGEARALLPDMSGELADLIAGTAGSSPYLRGLISAEKDWLPEALTNPEAAFDAVMTDVSILAPDETSKGLRVAKRRVALLDALCDLAGVWPLEQVTGRLTDFADAAVSAALRAALAPEIKRGKLPGMGEEALQDAGGMVVLAMGKMGAHELNYSSDIDLICLFDEARFDRDDYDDARASFVRATRKMAAMLSDQSGDGYVFRTDLRLRPDPAVTPVCMAIARAETYYESLGRTWERAAYIKARPCAGDIARGDQFLTALTPFIWRKHLDFAAIKDAHDMRLAIRTHKVGHGAIALPGHDMKLGRGGIREIEFFTQTQQLISGGRDPDLRLRGTVPAMMQLAEKGWIPQDTAQTLCAHYRFHREVEHRIQMVQDAQTHKLPRSPEGFDRLAALMGMDRTDLESALETRLNDTHSLIDGFFAPEEGASDPVGAPDPLVELDEEVIARWPSYPAMRSARAEEIFNRLRPEILTRLAAAVDPNGALSAFDGFLAGLPAGVQLFSMFEARPQLIDLLVDIASTAPRLAQYLSRNSSVFDGVIAGDFFAPWPGRAALHAELAGKLDAEHDYERKLDLTRRWTKEWHFRVGVHHLRGLATPDEAGQHYADLASATVGALWPEVIAQFSTKHGLPPGRGAAVLGMGSLGAAKLNAGSDLDLIVVYDAGSDDMSDGRRPLAARTYYARLTQALITALTAPMAQGRLYEVDMRLRPSGNQGPVATSWGAFQAYQREEAWVWEHLALTRACVIAGPDDLAEEIEAFRIALLAENGDRARILPGVIDMRRRLAGAKPPEGPWDVKLGAGRMQDIELIAQAAALMAGETARDVPRGLAAGARIGWLDAAAQAALQQAYGLCWTIQQIARLLGDSLLQPDALGEGGRAMLMRDTGFGDLDSLQQALDARCQDAANAIDSALQGYEGNDVGT